MIEGEMLDLHAHLLPAVDDGPASLDESLALCGELHRQGITEAVATPHWASPRFPGVEADRIAAAWDRLRLAGSPLRLHLGAENHLAPGVRAADFAARARPLGDAPVALVELPDEAVPQPTWEAFFLLRQRGLRAVLAHPERCSRLARSDPQLADFVADGGLLQLTAASLTGLHGWRMRWRSRRLLSRFPAACVIAGDTHHPSGPRRPCWVDLPARLRAWIPPSLAALAAWQGPGKP